jgi:hypothetical protein
MAQRTYRTEDGQDYFDFDVVRLPDDSLRAYITNMPSYGSRPTDLHSTHRYYDNSSERHYICFDGKVDSEENMLGVMKYWAEETQHMIRTGIPFRQPER